MDLATSELTLSFGEAPALRDVTLELPQGARVLLLGAQGAGKTSLLKALSGLVRPTRGQVRWDGQDPQTLDVRSRRAKQAAFGMVFQSDALFDSETVLENVRAPLLRRGLSGEEATARADEALRAVGLTEARQVLPERLSGGMRKRTGIARAIAARPAVLLADDPLAGLDPGTSRQICELLAQVAERCTVILCAHEPPPVLALSRWIFLERGRVLHDGPPRPELLDREPAVAP